MKTTVTIHANKGEISYAHNYRDETICSHEPHIDPNGVHEIWVKKSMNEVYDECFKDALEEYNAKQKRKDRRMTMEQYIDSVKNDKRGRKQTKRVNGKKVIDENARHGKQLAYEWTYKAGNTERMKDEKGNVMYDKDGHHIRPEELPYEVSYNATKRAIESFEETYPCFKLKDAVWHADEGFWNKMDVWEHDTVHAQITVVPMGHGYKGMAVQNSIGRALNEMGFNDGYDDDGRFVCAYEKFQEAEADRYAQFVEEEYYKYCKSHSDYARTHGTFERYRPVKNGERKGNMNKEEYAEYQELQEDIADAKVESRNVVLNQKKLRQQNEELIKKYKEKEIELKLLQKESLAYQAVIDSNKKKLADEAKRHKELEDREKELGEWANHISERQMDVEKRESELLDNELYILDLEDKIKDLEKKLSHYDKSYKARVLAEKVKKNPDFDFSRRIGD